MNSYELGPAPERVENIKLQWNRFSHNLRKVGKGVIVKKYLDML